MLKIRVLVSLIRPVPDDCRAMQFLPWQDGGVILLRGKLPLEGLMVFLGGAALKRAGTIRREGLQLSHVLPISERNFREMLQRIQQQTNMNVRNDPGKFVVQKLTDEGASSPFMAAALYRHSDAARHSHWQRKGKLRSRLTSTPHDTAGNQGERQGDFRHICRSRE